MMFQEGILGDYHLLLAHDVLAKNDEWVDLYARIRAGSWDPFIIMDNSLIELGHPMGPEDLIDAAELVDASCIVLADALGDAEKTINLSRDMVRDLDVVGNAFPLLGVVQGTSPEELKRCANAFKDLEVSYVSVPRVCTGIFGSRKVGIEIVQEVLPDTPIHLLGFSDDLEDDFACARMPGIMGIDSAVPIRLGLANQEFATESKVGKRAPNYLDSTEYNPAVSENIRIVRDLLTY